MLDQDASSVGAGACGRSARSDVSPRSRRYARWAVTVVAMVLAMTVTSGAVDVESSESPVVAAEPTRFGVSFSQRQSDYLMLPWAKVYAATLGLSPAVIRLGAYWDRIERTPGSYDFSVLELQLDRAGARGMDVILTVGMKAPRWPEYYLPRWLEERVIVGHGGDVSEDPEVRARVLAFVDRVVRHVRTHRAIVVWQVENEPLDPSGPNRWTIGEKLLAEEVALVRRLDDRPIIVSTFVDVDPLMNAPWRRAELRRRAEVILDLADILGLDLYPNRGLQLRGHDLYFHWPVWIWEAGDARAARISPGPRTECLDHGGAGGALGAEPPRLHGRTVEPQRPAAACCGGRRAAHRRRLRHDFALGCRALVHAPRATPTHRLVEFDVNVLRDGAGRGRTRCVGVRQTARRPIARAAWSTPQSVTNSREWHSVTMQQPARQRLSAS